MGEPSFTHMVTMYLDKSTAEYTLIPPFNFRISSLYPNVTVAISVQYYYII